MVAIASSAIGILKRGCYFRFIRAKIDRPLPGEGIFDTINSTQDAKNTIPPTEDDNDINNNRRSSLVQQILHSVRLSLMTVERERWPNLQYYCRPILIIVGIFSVISTALQIGYESPIIVIVEIILITLALGTYSYHNIDIHRVKMLFTEPGMYWLIVLFIFEAIFLFTYNTDDNTEYFVHIGNGYLFLIGIIFWIATDTFYFVDKLLVMILSFLAFLVIIYNLYNVFASGSEDNGIIIDYKNKLRRQEAKLMIYSTVLLLLLRTVPSIIQYKCSKLLFIQPPLQNKVLSRVIYSFHQPKMQNTRMIAAKSNESPQVKIMKSKVPPSEMEEDKLGNIPEEWAQDRWSLARENHTLGNIHNEATKPGRSRTFID